MLTLIALFFSHADLFAKSTVLKISTPFPEKSAEAETWKVDAKKVLKKDLKIDWNWSQPEKLALEALSKEKIDGIIISGPSLNAMSKTASMIEKPYLYPQKDDAAKFLQKNKKIIESELSNYGLYPWRQFYIAPVYFYAKKDFEKTKDFSNVKIWLWSAASPVKNWIDEQKAKAVSSPPQKVLEKLKNGEIEMVFGIESAVERLDWAKQATFKSKTAIAQAFGYILIRKKIYDKFSKSQQDIE